MDVPIRIPTGDGLLTSIYMIYYQHYGPIDYLYLSALNSDGGQEKKELWKYLV